MPPVSRDASADAQSAQATSTSDEPRQPQQGSRLLRHESESPRKQSPSSRPISGLGAARWSNTLKVGELTAEEMKHRPEISRKSAIPHPSDSFPERKRNRYADQSAQSRDGARRFNKEDKLRNRGTETTPAEVPYFRIRRIDRFGEYAKPQVETGSKNDSFTHRRFGDPTRTPFGDQITSKLPSADTDVSSRPPSRFSFPNQQRVASKLGGLNMEERDRVVGVTSTSQHTIRGAERNAGPQTWARDSTFKNSPQDSTRLTLLRPRMLTQSEPLASFDKQQHKDNQEPVQEWQHLRTVAPRRENAEAERIKNLAADLREGRATSGERPVTSGGFISFDNHPPAVDPAPLEPPQFWQQPMQETRHSRRRDGVSQEEQPRGFRVDDKRKKGRRRMKSSRFREEEGEEDDDALSRIERRRQRKQEKMVKRAKNSTPILLPEYISISNLAQALRIRVEDFADKLMDLGFEDFGSDHVVDAETAGLIASEFNFEPILPKTASSEDIMALPPPDDTSLLLSRPPVITIMGHVDHGKTTLLDWLRKSSVAASEHGGITQHIGAFTVSMPSGRIMTFLDTPGHAAFLDMRARGANVTDIVILVVAADDSVKPQTIEAIKHAKAAKVPIIVAINKIDKEGSDPERVKQDLARHGVDVEDFGGDTQTVCVSGKTGQGMEELEDAAITLADVLDVRADITGQVEGWVLEATKKKSGKVATVLVRRGTLEPGTILVAGQAWTRVRSLRNDAGVIVSSAGPGTPVEVDGWRKQPEAGDEALQAPDEQRARCVVDFRAENAESARTADDVASINEARQAEELRRQRELSDKEASDAVQTEAPDSRLVEVPFILRADVSGSVEALEAAVLGLGNSEVRARILRTAVGPLSPSDVDHAATIKGHLISFNLPIDGSIMQQAERQGIRLLDDSVIYRLVDEVKSLLEEKLPPSITSRVTGEAEVAQVFEITVKGGKLPVAGCKVRNGTMNKGSKVRIIRGGKTVHDGECCSTLLSIHSLSLVTPNTVPLQQLDLPRIPFHSGSFLRS